jgi:hypothetical protein
MKNLIENDPLVSAIFTAVTNAEGTPQQKIQAVRRAGQIAEAYLARLPGDAFQLDTSGIIDLTLASPSAPAASLPGPGRADRTPSAQPASPAGQTG